ncbi:hypothetical protein Dsin_005138 [Dipteronia sinensis]|uniref:Transposase n=1 Tax=Dipteronia sinensis TaxID=43782 RepID=A0AAE0EEE8_9ROSI|nr:hypothetical protein Dsin_005138 [Dipteronia sinensis]
MADLEGIDAEQEAILAQHVSQSTKQPVTIGSSIPSHIVINRDRESVDRRLFYDYFVENPWYKDQMFCQRFRMGRSLFLRIVEKMEACDNYFVQRRDSVGQYAGRSGSLTIILEAITDYDLWIWHAYFGLPCTNNDINVLETSHLFSNLAQCIAHPAHYVIQGKEYNMSYYLADGTYPKWFTLVQTIQDPRDRKKKLFAMKQEGCRKDVERAFGVLQTWFAIVAGSARFWHKHVLHDIMTTYIIMHNMIIENERGVDASIENHMEAPTLEVEMMLDENTQFREFLAQHREIKDKKAHIAL